MTTQEFRELDYFTIGDEDQNDFKTSKVFICRLLKYFSILSKSKVKMFQKVWSRNIMIQGY